MMVDFRRWLSLFPRLCVYQLRNPGWSEVPKPGAATVAEVKDVFALVASRHAGNVELRDCSGPGPAPVDPAYWNDEISNAG